MSDKLPIFQYNGTAINRANQLEVYFSTDEENGLKEVFHAIASKKKNFHFSFSQYWQEIKRQNSYFKRGQWNQKTHIEFNTKPQFNHPELMDTTLKFTHIWKDKKFEIAGLKTTTNKGHFDNKDSKLWVNLDHMDEFNQLKNNFSKIPEPVIQRYVSFIDNHLRV
jgi:hypothetical protein